MQKGYTICLGCGSVQIRTDIDEVLDNKSYVLIKNNKMCSKCHKVQQFIATKDIKKLRKSLNQTHTLEQRLNKCIR